MMQKSLLPYFIGLVLIVVTASCTSDKIPEPMDANNPPPSTSIEPPTIWSGRTIAFSKSNGADPDQAGNQDRLTDNVWLTRGNSGGQIYNAKVENGANKSSSPSGTRWAEGTIDQIDQLSFTTFRAAVGEPKNVLGKNLVLFLPNDNIYISIRFTSWAQGKAGGFSYERSTP